MKPSDDQVFLPLRPNKSMDEPVVEYPSDPFQKCEGGPTVFGEEIGDRVPCCVLSLEATPLPPSESQIFTLPTGHHLLKEFRRTMQFNLMMDRAEDAARIKVIQYNKNESYKVSGDFPPPVSLPAKPVGESWTWQPGSDGWTVDSLDTDRCWPDYHPRTATHGVRRRAIWVSWFDRVGWGRARIQEQIRNGNPGYIPARFPHVYSVEFKTDIICTDKAVCGNTGAVDPGAFVVARVFWRFRLAIHRIIDESVVVVRDAIIDNIRKEIILPCPNSPFF